MNKQDIVKTIEKSMDKMRNRIDSSIRFQVLLSIIFAKFASEKIRYTFNKAKKINKDIKTFQDYIVECEFNGDYQGVEEEYLWENIMKSSQDEIKSKFDKFYESLKKINPEQANDLKIYNFSSGDLSSSNLFEILEIVNENVVFKKENYQDIFGFVYEYFIGKYSISQKRGGEFYTPHSVVKLMTNITEFRLDKNKKEITVYDPTCGSVGMLVQSLSFLQNIGFDKKSLYFYGQELNKNPWRFARINFFLRSANSNFGKSNDDTFLYDHFKNQKFDIILSNPPFNQNFEKDRYKHLINDPRFKQWGIVFGAKKANYNFFSHILSHLNKDGIAAVVMQSAAGQSTQKEMEIRKRYLDQNLIEAIISLPKDIFSNTGIATNIWVFNMNKKYDNILFMDLTGYTKRINVQEVITDETIEEVKTIFKKFITNGEKTKDGKIPHNVVSLEKVKTKQNYALSVPNNVVHKVEETVVDPKQLAKELNEVKEETQKVIDEVEKVISYLTK